MRSLTAISATVLLLALPLAVAQTSNPISAFDQQLVDQQKQFLQAADSNDAGVVSAAIADDFQGVGTNGDLYDKSEVVDSAHGAKPQTARSYDFHVIKLNAESAVVTYNLITPGQHPRYRRMADTWAKLDGQWKLKFRQITPNLWSANDLD